MKNAASRALVTTIEERCRVCYTCVRECPAKAIRIADGQARVLPQRCIGCGNCVRVCSQHAKRVYDSKEKVEELLHGRWPVAAIVAPSFPAEFVETDVYHFVGMLRALGFDYVNEVSFGADLVAAKYRSLLDSKDGHRYIATNCPAVVAYVERYRPELVENLAPIVSPMIAAARVLRRLHGKDLRIVFIGPCIAKKGEIESAHLDSEVDAALTFVELRELFYARGIRHFATRGSALDPPFGGPGGLFPISRGLLQAAHIQEDLIQGSVVAVDGRTQFVEAIDEFASGQWDASLLEVLACNGCINGPGISKRSSLFLRRSEVSKYVRERLADLDWERWQLDIQRFQNLDLTRQYTQDDQRIPVPSEDELVRLLAQLGKVKPEDELNCGACGYDTCREHAIAIHKGLAENEMCLPYVIEQLRSTMGDLAVSNTQLEQTREALVQSEKLASMGQLAAGIAHELNNPLGVVLLYSHLLQEGQVSREEMCDDLNTIAEQADRCKKIVAGLLHFARQNKVELEPTDVRVLIERALKSAPPPEGIRAEVIHELDPPELDVDRDQMLQVLTNLMLNAYAAMPSGGLLTIRTFQDNGRDHIRVEDTGSGIPKEIRDKIFEPFFTTKEAGKGTGLGLAVTYGIVKMHSGDIRVVSNHDPAAGPTGTAFTVSLPRQWR